MFRLVMKLKSVKDDLKDWNARQFSNIQGRTEKAKSNLEAIQMQLQRAPNDPHLVQEELNAIKVFATLARQEEDFCQEI